MAVLRFDAGTLRLDDKAGNAPNLPRAADPRGGAGGQSREFSGFAVRSDQVSEGSKGSGCLGYADKI